MVWCDLAVVDAGWMAGLRDGAVEAFTETQPRRVDE